MQTWEPQVRAHTLALVRHASVVGSEGERACADVIAQRLRAMPYFAAHPQQVRVLRTEGDPLERYNVVALVRGPGSRAVMLTGHYDVVSTANYGPLEPLACDPAALLPRLIAELQAAPRGPADQLALDDLLSGDFMPGRGALDMKSGLAVGLAVLERFAAHEDRTGSLVMVFTPDEEATSHGMRSFARQWPALRAEWQLQPVLAINLDASVAPGDGAEGRAVFLGSVAKMLPFAYLVGRPTHAGAPFDGVNAALLAAALVREVECNPDYGDGAPTQAELPPVPVTLQSVDLKGAYDVTTPAHAFTAFNVLTFGASPAEVLGRFRRATERAFEDARAVLGRRAARSSAPAAPADGAWRVLAYADLCALAVRAAGATLIEDALAQYAANPNLDALGVSRAVVAELVRAAGLEGPAAIIGFAPIYYPLAVAPASALTRAVASAAEATARAHATTIALRPFFTGISDMSFLAAGASGQGLEVMAANTPAWNARWSLRALDPDDAPGLIVNIGPWGRDYHQRAERVHMPYSLKVLPELIWRVMAAALTADNR